MKKLLIPLLLYLPLASFGQGNFLELIKVVDSVYVFKPKIDWTHSNCAVIIGPDGLFIIDTFLQTNYADEAIRRLKEVSTLPVKYIFNTHCHGDHVIGNPIFKAAFPNSVIIMNSVTSARYPRQHANYGSIKPYAESISELEKEIAGDKTTEGYIFTKSLKDFYKLQLEEAKAYVKSYTPIEPANADIMFSDSLTIRFGNHDIILMPVSGEGHDVGDAMAWLPKKKILITGDIVVAPTPYAIRGRVSEMIQSLQQIIDINPAFVIPGHGEIQQGTGYVRLEQELFKTIQQKSLDAIRDKIPYSEAKTKITIPAELEVKFTGNDDVRKWAMKSFFTIWTVYGTYKENDALPPRKD